MASARRAAGSGGVAVQRRGMAGRRAAGWEEKGGIVYDKNRAVVFEEADEGGAEGLDDFVKHYDADGAWPSVVCLFLSI